MQALTQLRNSSPNPARRISYQSYASAMSRSASGARIRLAAMTTADPPLDLFPGESGGRVFLQVRLPAGEFGNLPLMHRHVGRRRGQVIPKVFDELEFFCRAEVKDGHGSHSRVSVSGSSCSSGILLRALAFPQA